MKKLLLTTLFCWLAVVAMATDLKVTLSDFTVTPSTNRTVYVSLLTVPTASSSSTVIGSRITYTSDTNGVFYISNIVQNCLYSMSVQAPPSRTDFTVQILDTDTGLINAHSNMVAFSTSTFPAGSVAWSAISSDLRYLRSGTPATNVVWPVAGANITMVTNGLAVTISSSASGGGVGSPGRNLETNATTINTITNPAFTIVTITNPAAGGTSAQLNISGNTGSGGFSDNLAANPDALNVSLGGSGRFVRVPKFVNTGAEVIQGGSTIGTSAIFTNGAGTTLASIDSTDGSILAQAFKTNFVSRVNSTPRTHTNFTYLPFLTNSPQTLFGMGQAGDGSFVGGGMGNSATGYLSVVVGGRGGFAGNTASFIGMSYPNNGNAVLEDGGAIVAGQDNLIDNRIGGTLSFIGNGNDCYIAGQFNFIGGGNSQKIAGGHNAIVGGYHNTIGDDVDTAGDYSFIGGGRENNINHIATNAFIGGGSNNNVYGNYSAILAGFNNTVGGSNSMAIGHNLTVYTNNMIRIGVGNSHSMTLGVLGITNSDYITQRGSMQVYGALATGNTDGGHNVFNADGSASLADGFASWDDSGNFSINRLIANDNVTFLGVSNWVSGILGVGGNTLLRGSSNWISGKLTIDGLTKITPGSTATTANLGIDTSGNIVTNSSPIGANGSQTPWTSTEDAAGFSLTNFGSLYSSNSLLASGATVYQTNSGFFPLFYLGTNSPLKTTSSSAIANGALGGSNIFIVESPGHPNDFAIRTNGAIVLGHPAASATVVNLGLSADGTITTNASPVGVVSASTDAAAWHTNGDNTASGQTGIWGYTNGNAMDMRMNLNGANGAAVLQFRTIANSEGVNIYMGNSNSPVSNTEFNLSLIGGSHNTAAAGLTGASIFGGQYNSVNNDYAAVLGGQSNLALGHYSVAMGQAADAANDNSFVFNGIPNKILATSGSGGDNGAVKFGITAFLEITNSAQGYSRDFGSGHFSTNTTVARASVTWQTNSPINSMLYMGTNSPGNGKGTDIGNGSIGSTNLVQIDALLFPGALMVGTNGNVYASNTVQAATLVAVGATGSNRFGANVDIVGTVNATGYTNSSSTASRVVLTDANKAQVSATASGAVPIDADGTATTAAQIATIVSPTNYAGATVFTSMAALTNSGSSVSFDFTKLVSLLTTNNAFVTLGLSGKDSSGKDMQWCTLAVTNSAGLGAAFVTNITFAANTHIIGPTTLNLTNWTELLCEYWPPNGPTNVFVTPCW